MRVKQLLAGVVIALIAMGCRRDDVESTNPEPAPKDLSSARLVIQNAALEPGSTSEIGIMIELVEGWHTYTDPPGDSGMAPVLSMTLPAGIAAGPLRYPPHQTFTDDSGTTFGFEDQVLLRIPLTIAKTIDGPRQAPFKAVLDYLICKDTCLPQRAELTGTLPIGMPPSGPDMAWQQALMDGGWKQKTEPENK